MYYLLSTVSPTNSLLVPVEITTPPGTSALTPEDAISTTPPLTSSQLPTSSTDHETPEEPSAVMEKPKGNSSQCLKIIIEDKTVLPFNIYK